MYFVGEVRENHVVLGRVISIEGEREYNFLPKHKYPAGDNTLLIKVKHA
jgi:hypothetical protein